MYTSCWDFPSRNFKEVGASEPILSLLGALALLSIHFILGAAVNQEARSGDKDINYFDSPCHRLSKLCLVINDFIYRVLFSI